MRAGTVVGGAVAGAGAVIWAVGIAIYQPIMEPTGLFFWDGSPYPQLASNNTYWPREVRHLGILLAVAGIIAIHGAAVRAIAVAGSMGLFGIVVDLWCDRADVAGNVGWLAAAGVATVAGAAILARGRPAAPASAAPPSPEVGRYLTAVTAAVLAGAPTVVTTPWSEPVSDPAWVAIENELALINILLGAGFTAVAIVVGRLDRRSAVAVAAVATAMVVTVAYFPRAQALLFVMVGLQVTLVAVVAAAARRVPGRRLAAVAAACVVAVPPLFWVLFLGGLLLGEGLTGLAGNPPVNSADFDSTYALPALVVGLAVAVVNHGVTRRDVAP